MAVTNKNRKIIFLSIRRQEKDTIDTTPAHILKNTIEYIKGLDRDKRFFNLNSRKCCFLESISLTGDKDTHKVVFKSAKIGSRPPLIDMNTRKERKSPKAITEGEGERTHAVIKYTKKDVYFILESNGLGVGINSIHKYLRNFVKLYLKSKKGKVGFKLIFQVLVKDNFIQEMKKLKRVVVGQVFVEKSILGSDALNFSDRIQTVRHDIIIDIRANAKETILNAIEDTFNKFSSATSKISKIRVEGKSKNSGDVVIDTSFIQRVENISVDTNALTGEINSTNIFTQLMDISKSLK